jgi:hypothetical protein
VQPRALSAGGSTWTKQGLVVGVKTTPPQAEEGVRLAFGM